MTSFDFLLGRKPLDYHVRQLAQARALVGLVKETLDLLQAEMDAAYAGRLDALYTELNEAKVWETETTQRIRDAAVRQFDKDGDKKPHPAVSVGEYTVLDYDEDVALEWARIADVAIKLDKRAFEKLAKAMPLDFVEISKEPRARISTKLDEYLEVE